MPVIKPTCGVCGKRVDLTSEILLSGKTYLETYSCGHTTTREKLQFEGTHVYTSLSGTKEAYDFQKDGISFIEATDYNCLIADGMGLGKTIQATLAIRNNKEKLTPTLAVVQSSVVYQWCKENKEWFSDSFTSVFPIIGTTGFIPHGFDVYVISRDTLGRKNFYKKLLPFGFKFIIVDEVQGFKDPNSNRSNALVSLIKEGNIKHKLFLSGTPIKNKAGEYFTVLNLLAPQHFPSYARFQRYWLEAEQTPSGAWIYKRLKSWRVEEFQQLLSKYVIRREKHDVMKSLPPFQRNFQYVTIDDPDVKNSYNRELQLMDNFINSGKRFGTVDLLGWLARLRRITGFAKCAFTRAWIEQFLDSTDNEKICIGIHHKDVRQNLSILLNAAGYKTITLSGEDSPEKKAQIVEDFRRDENRVLVANMIAGGVGLNLQYCNNAVVMERMWNAVDEEQFEARFHRDGQTRPVTAEYFIAAGTIDEFLTNKVEEKREIFKETVQGIDLTDDYETLYSIAQQAIANPLR